MVSSACIRIAQKPLNLIHVDGQRRRVLRTDGSPSNVGTWFLVDDKAMEFLKGLGNAHARWNQLWFVIFGQWVVGKAIIFL